MGEVDAQGPRWAGQLLVATPRIEEPPFRRSVVLVLDHDDDGALGIVVNHQLSVEVASVLPGWEVGVTPPGLIHGGGPVAPEAALGLVALRPAADQPPADEAVAIRRLSGSSATPGGLGLVDLDAEPDDVVPRLRAMRVYAGYSGWSSGQLEAEVEEGAWCVVPSEPTDVFTDDPEGLWRRVLRRQPGDLAWLATYPDDPSAN